MNITSPLYIHEYRNSDDEVRFCLINKHGAVLENGFAEYSHAHNKRKHIKLMAKTMKRYYRETMKAIGEQS